MSETMDEGLDIEADDIPTTGAPEQEQDLDPYRPPTTEQGARMTALYNAIQINGAGNSDSVLRDAMKFEKYIMEGTAE